jgi:hypothetical protein
MILRFLILQNVGLSHLNRVCIIFSLLKFWIGLIDIRVSKLLMRNLEYILSFGKIIRDAIVDGIIKGRSRFELVELFDNKLIYIGLFLNLLIVKLR